MENPMTPPAFKIASTRALFSDILHDDDES
jgi:hypothetical protein